MFEEPEVIAALIGLIGITVGIIGYAVQNWLIKKREIENREFEIKRNHYEKIVRLISDGVHQVKTLKKSTSNEYKKDIDAASHVLSLYASDEVLKSFNEFFSGKDTNENFKKLILLMRKDLIKTNLTETDMEWTRAK